ncbi:MAG: C1 family peptidase [Eubacteriales bacterium]|nr:C1 family peptidase [Eubacteriales bacterium]
MKEEITVKDLAGLDKKYEADPRSAVLRHALSTSTFENVFTSLDHKEDEDFSFSIDLKMLPVSDQKRSGRCWIFSASTILREIIAKKLDIKGQFEISQNYISYFDKLEKANYAMGGVIDLALKGEKPGDRKIDHLLHEPISDGGQWDMYSDIVKKYGVVPKAVFPETAQSNATAKSTQLLSSLVRQFARDVYATEKKATRNDFEKIKTSYMEKVYNLLTDCFGKVPTSFTYSYTDNKGAFHRLENMTPLSFFDTFVGKEIDEYVSLIDAPTSDKKVYQTYSVELVGNVVGGKPVTHLNVPYEELEKNIIAQLKAGYPVWFGSDVSYYGDRQGGVWDTNAFDYKSAFGCDIAFDKADMLTFRESAMNHAMVICGVDLTKDGKPTRWKIENSWGKENGKDGFYLMSEDFFRLFVYQAAIRKDFLTEKEKEALKTKPVLLAPWDPFGTLAD